MIIASFQKSSWMQLKLETVEGRQKYWKYQKILFLNHFFYMIEQIIVPPT